MGAMKKLILIPILFLISSCSSYQIYETGGGFRSVGYIDSLRGANEMRDAEQMGFARNIILSAGQPYVDEYGTDYTGVIKIYIWDYDKQVMFTALRQIKEDDGRIGWQGPNPPRGFYGEKKEEIVIYSLSPDVQKMLMDRGIL